MKNLPKWLNSAFCSVVDCSWGDSALLPSGNKCLDWGNHHCPPRPCAVFCGYQIVPNSKKHPGKLFLLSSPVAAMSRINSKKKFINVNLHEDVRFSFYTIYNIIFLSIIQTWLVVMLLKDIYWPNDCDWCVDQSSASYIVAYIIYAPLSHRSKLIKHS